MLSITSRSPVVIPNAKSNDEAKIPTISDRIADISMRILHSNMLKTLVIGSCIGAAITIFAMSEVIAITTLAAVITAAAILVLGMHTVVNKKKIIYEVSLFATLLLKTFIPNSYAWWHDVAPNLSIGAVPLKNFGHDEKIVKDLGVKAVLSLMEDFEFDTKGLFSVPCTSLDWKKLGVTHMTLPTTDFKPVSLDVIEKGVAFLEEQTNKDIKCYVHCKAGQTRGPTVVLAYLLKKGIVPSVDEGIKYLKQRRTLISISPDVKSILENYFQKHCVSLK